MWEYQNISQYLRLFIYMIIYIIREQIYYKWQDYFVLFSINKNTAYLYSFQMKQLNLNVPVRYLLSSKSKIKLFFLNLSLIIKFYGIKKCSK